MSHGMNSMFSSVARSALIDSLITSGPMPSPGITAILCFLAICSASILIQLAMCAVELLVFGLLVDLIY